MPDDSTRSTAIERTINRDIANALTVAPHGGAFSVAPQNVGELLEFAKLMSVSGFCVRPAFRGNPGACLGVSMQAFRCGGDPFAWANKAYITKNRAGEEQISYEAQLIHAVVNSSAVLQRRLRPVYEGEGASRRCLVVGWVKGETEALEYLSPPISQIGVKNSPLWVSDPDQQLFYYSTRAWARRHVPEVLLGIYAPEELAETIDLTPEPEPRREDFVRVAPPDPVDDRPVYTVVDLDGVEHEFREAETAEGALARVLAEAERQGPERLAGARESNTGEGLMLALPPPPPPPKRIRSRVAADSVSPPEAQEPQPWPLDDPTTREEVVQHGRPEEVETEAPPGRDPDGAAPTPEPEANDDPDRGSLEISPPMRRGKPDYRTWMIALFLPKLIQAKTTDELAFRLGDNEAHLTAARRELARDDLATLEEAIATRWREIGNG